VIATLAIGRDFVLAEQFSHLYPPVFLFLISGGSMGPIESEPPVCRCQEAQEAEQGRAIPSVRIPSMLQRSS
jgi:hypothetical protein